MKMCGRVMDERWARCVLEPDHEESWHLTLFGYPWHDGQSALWEELAVLAGDEWPAQVCAQCGQVMAG